MQSTGSSILWLGFMPLAEFVQLVAWRDCRSAVRWDTFPGGLVRKLHIVSGLVCVSWVILRVYFSGSCLVILVFWRVLFPHLHSYDCHALVASLLHLPCCVCYIVVTGL